MDTCNSAHWRDGTQGISLFISNQCWRSARITKKPAWPPCIKPGLLNINKYSPPILHVVWKTVAGAMDHPQSLSHPENQEPKMLCQIKYVRKHFTCVSENIQWLYSSLGLCNIHWPKKDLRSLITDGVLHHNSCLPGKYFRNTSKHTECKQEL